MSLPSGAAEIVMPCCWAPMRRTVTANSRAMITIATHASSRLSETSASSAPMISSLSATGSISLPNVVMLPRERAR